MGGRVVLERTQIFFVKLELLAFSPNQFTQLKEAQFSSPLFKRSIFPRVLMCQILKYNTFLDNILKTKFFPVRLISNDLIFMISTKDDQTILAFKLKADLVE